MSSRSEPGRTVPDTDPATAVGEAAGTLAGVLVSPPGCCGPRRRRCSTWVREHWLSPGWWSGPSLLWSPPGRGWPASAPSRCRPRRRHRRRHRPDVGPRRPPRRRPPPARTARVDRSTSATRPMRQRGKGKTGTGPCGPGVPDAGRTVLRGTAPAAQGGLPVALWTRTSTPGFLPGSGGRAGRPCAGVLGDVGLGVWSGRIGLWPGRAARGTPASASRVRCACPPRFRPGTAATSRVPPRGGRRSPPAPAGTPPPLAAPTGWESTPRTASRIWLWSWTACSVSSWARSTPCSSSG